MAPMLENGQCRSFNGDGKPDILVRNFETGDLLVYPHSGRFDGLGTYGEPVKIADDFGWQRYYILRAIDVDGSGYADLMAVNIPQVNTGEHGVFVYRNKGAGLNGLDTLRTDRVRVSGKREDRKWETMGIADLTGDGSDDMFSREKDQGNVDAFLNRGAVVEHETYDKTAVPLVDVAPEDFPFAMADFAGTGRNDLLVRRANGDLDLYVFPADGAAKNSGTWYTIARGWDRFKIMTLADVDLDGRPDLLALDQDGTLSAYVNSGKLNPDDPAELLNAPVTVATGWTAYDVVS
jgi:hypothetical protein